MKIDYVGYSRITLVVPNYKAAPRLFYLEYFRERYINCDSAAHQELPMCESRKFCDDPASWSVRMHVKAPTPKILNF